MTICELQRRITPSEVIVWQAYRRKYGPMSPVRKYDMGPAVVASIVSKAHGGKSEPIDFMPYAPRPPEPEPDDAIAMLLSNPMIKRGR